MIDHIRLRFKEAADALTAFMNDEENLKKVEAFARMIVESVRSGGKLVVFGNGGSAADSLHFTCELVGRFYKDREPIPAISLASNVSCLTALPNDYSYDIVFERQVKAIVNPNDVVVGISTSGKSVSVLRAMRAAKERGAKVVGLTGAKGDPMCEVSDLCIKVPSASTPRIQEVHEVIYHVVSELVERELSGS